MTIRHLAKFLVITIFLFDNGVSAIGEGVLDLNALMGIFSGMANIFTGLNTTDIDIDRMMGKWHQMYKAALNFDVFKSNVYCEVSYFSRNRVMGREGFSIEEAFHVISKTGPIEVYKRDVAKTGTGEFWMYTEEYFYPRQFYILNAGPDDPNHNETSSSSSSTTKSHYEYLIVTDSNRLALMVFARDPQTFHELYDKEIQRFLSQQGFGGYVFWNQPVAIYQGTDCYYPSYQEVFTRRVIKGNSPAQRPPSAPTIPILSSSSSSSSSAVEGTASSPHLALSQDQASLLFTQMRDSQLLQQQRQQKAILARQQAAALEARRQATLWNGIRKGVDLLGAGGTSVGGTQSLSHQDSLLLAEPDGANLQQVTNEDRLRDQPLTGGDRSTSKGGQTVIQLRKDAIKKV